MFYFTEDCTMLCFIAVMEKMEHIFPVMIKEM